MKIIGTEIEAFYIEKRRGLFIDSLNNLYPFYDWLNRLYKNIPETKRESSRKKFQLETMRNLLEQFRRAYATPFLLIRSKYAKDILFVDHRYAASLFSDINPVEAEKLFKEMLVPETHLRLEDFKSEKTTKLVKYKVFTYDQQQTEQHLASFRLLEEARKYVNGLDVEYSLITDCSKKDLRKAIVFPQSTLIVKL